MESTNKQFDLIITVVNKGFSGEVIDASRKAGAEGGTILHGRGTGIHEKAKFFGITIEPEKEIIFTLTKKETTKQILDAIAEGAHLHKPGRGIAFVVDVSKVVGITHIEDILNGDFEKEEE